MIKDTVRPNGKIKRVQYVKAVRKGTSSMGKPYKKGDAILHLSSSRCTGETFVLLPTEIAHVLMEKPGTWNPRKTWEQQLHKKWERNFIKLHGHAPGARCEHPAEFYRSYEEGVAAKMWRRRYAEEMKEHGVKKVAEELADQYVANGKWRNEGIKGR